MADLYVWGGAAVAFIVAVVGAWVSGHSKGKTTAEAKASEEKSEAVVVATKAAAERQTTVSKEAAHVDQTVNNLGNDDVDKQLSDKWSR